MLAKFLHNGNGIVQVSKEHHSKVGVQDGHFVAWQEERAPHCYQQRDDKEVEKLCWLAGHLADYQSALK